jgi:transposase
MNKKPPQVEREEKPEPFREAILELYASCKGNLLRVHEELKKSGATFSYTTLTDFCRRHALVKPPDPPAGHYDFAPGQEMQHDTSPHDAKIGGETRRVQTASLVLCYSRTMYVQMYPRFTRFECKQFLTEAMTYIGGACGFCMIDNTHVVVVAGTGREMKASPEMEAFSERFSFVFIAHERGDADRKGRVERPFHFIERNFLAGRTFADFAELNREAVAWCDRQNASFKRHLHATPRELLAAEKPALKPLPLWIPEPYVLHHRIVSVDGYVKVNSHLYSAPYQLIGKRMEVRETKERIVIYDGPRIVGEHAVSRSARPTRITDASHRPPRETSDGSWRRPAEEDRLRKEYPELEGYVTELRKKAAGRGTLALRELRRLLEDYPREPVMKALAEAARYGLFDMERVERMILKNVRTEFFRLKDDAE